MKQNLNRSNKRFVSPFPGKRENEEFIKSFNLTPIGIKDKTVSNVRTVYIPPEMTKSYMAKNPFYFEMKNKMKQDVRIIKKNKINSFNNIKTFFTEDKSHQVIDKNKILNLLIENGTSEYFLSEKLKYLKQKNSSHDKKSDSKDKKSEKKLQPSQIKIESNMSDKIFSQSLCRKENFGIVPEYIKQFRIRETIEKEYERLTNEEKKYPKGTIKLSELERLNILKKIKEEKENLLIQLRSLPISSHVRSIKIQNLKRALESKLEEFEYMTRILERNEVFIKK